MQFLCGPFLVFLPLAFGVYYLTPKKHRYLPLLIANYIFYGWNNIAAVPVLVLSTLITYLGGRILEKRSSRRLFALFFTLNILILAVFKYTNFAIGNVNRLAGLLLPGASPEGLISPVELLSPIGLSFYIFQSTTYLSDVYRKGMESERNFLRYAAFVSFFPSILSGPIQRSRELLPQLRQPEDFSFDHAYQGFLLLIWGFFQKIVISGQLAAISNQILDSYHSYKNIYFALAACCYSLYIYCDFSSYSDMACGVAQLLGFRVRPNFRNPYLAESLADFWNRWHMSLNNWFIENIYIPLGGSRKGKLRKYCNIMVVFLISGIWHGASWHFIFWGVLNGFLRVMGEILAPAREKLYALLKLEKNSFSMRFLRRACVFCMITLTWVFFRMPAMSAGVHVIREILAIRPIHLFDSGLLDLFTTGNDILWFIFTVTLFIVVQYLRKEEGRLYRVFMHQPLLLRCIAVAAAICICLFGLVSGAATFDTQFIYFQF